MHDPTHSTPLIGSRRSRSYPLRLWQEVLGTSWSAMSRTEAQVRSRPGQRVQTGDKEERMTALETRLARTERLLEISHELASTTSLERLLHRIVEAAVELTGSETAGILLEQGGELRFVAVHLFAEQLFDIPVPIDTSVAGACFSSGEVMIVPDVRETPCYYREVEQAVGYEARSLLAVPLESGEQRIGVLEVENKVQPRDTFRAEDVETLRVLAAQATMAIQNARLVEALQEAQAYARTVAHNLKNPLGLLNGYANLMAQELERVDLANETVVECAETIIDTSSKMGAIVDELLRFAWVGSVQHDLLEPLDMASILFEVEQRLAALMHAHEAQVIQPSAWPTAVGYGPWVEEVWSNYVSNAIVYGGRSPDGVPPRVQVGADPLPVLGDAGKPMIRFWVRDNGPGLAPEEQDRLFAEFQQLSNGNGNGHGLGLSIARRIVEKLGGKVGVESAPGQGSLFYFTLPAANGHRGAHAA
jgi:two-component system sensor histidine kinase/response regulator